MSPSKKYGKYKVWLPCVLEYTLRRDSIVHTEAQNIET